MSVGHLPRNAKVLYNGAFMEQGLDDNIRDIEDYVEQVKKRGGTTGKTQRTITSGNGYPLYIWWWTE